MSPRGYSSFAMIARRMLELLLPVAAAHRVRLADCTFLPFGRAFDLLLIDGQIYGKSCCLALNLIFVCGSCSWLPSTWIVSLISVGRLIPLSSGINRSRSGFIRKIRFDNDELER